MAYTYTTPEIQWAESDTATFDIVDPNDVNNILTLSTKIEPPPAFQQTGQIPQEAFTPQYYNFTFNNLLDFTKENKVNINNSHDAIESLENTSISTPDAYLSNSGTLGSAPQVILNTAAIINLLYGVGDIIIMNSTQDPNTRWSGTTWVKVAAGEVLVGQDTGTFSTLGASVGSETVTLVDANMPDHDHYMFTGTNGSADDLGRGTLTPANADKAVHVGSTINTQDDEYSLGASDTGTADKGKTSTYGETTPTPVNVVQPSMVVVYWQRTA